jgi:hypothetical protein
MPLLEQFEVFQLSGERWEFVAGFPVLDLATEIARTRGANVRVVRATYENGKKVAEDIIVDLGATRGAA